MGARIRERECSANKAGNMKKKRTKKLDLQQKIQVLVLTNILQSRVGAAKVENGFYLYLQSHRFSTRGLVRGISYIIYHTSTRNSKKKYVARMPLVLELK